LSLPELLKKSVEHRLARYCEAKIPNRVKDKIKLTVGLRGNNVTLFENRPHYLDPETWTKSKVAQFRFDPAKKVWSLFCCDRNGRWHLYSRAAPASSLEPLIQALDEDVTGIFWG